MVRLMKRFMIPIIALVGHTLLVIVCWVGIWSSDDPVAVMGWIIFDVIDWPVSIVLFPAGNDGIEFVLGLLMFGGLQWTANGAVLQLILERISTSSQDHKGRVK
jgi:hypothetical protein